MRKRIVRGRLSYGMADRTLRHMTGEPIITLPNMYRERGNSSTVNDVFIEENCRKAFEALGIVPINAQVVLDRLEVRLHTPPAPLLPETPWQSKTLSNM
jgi:hypothetical protein